METIKDRLNYLIQEKTEGNLRKFARKLGVPHPTLYKFSEGRMPNAETLTALVNTFDVNVNWLLTGRGERYIEGGKGVHSAQREKEIDIELLSQCIKLIEEYLINNKKELDIDKKARAITTLYLSKGMNVDLIMSLVF